MPDTQPERGMPLMPESLMYLAEDLNHIANEIDGGNGIYSQTLRRASMHIRDLEQRVAELERGGREG